MPRRGSTGDSSDNDFGGGGFDNTADARRRRHRPLSQLQSTMATNNDEKTLTDRIRERATTATSEVSD